MKQGNILEIKALMDSTREQGAGLFQECESSLVDWFSSLEGECPEGEGLCRIADHQLVNGRVIHAVAPQYAEELALQVGVWTRCRTRRPG